MDLQTIFSTVLNMTITGSVVIGCVLLARLALAKAPRGFACVLWLVVLFRLLSPVAPAGPVSVLSVVDAPKAGAPVSTVVYVESPVQTPVETIHVTPDTVVEVVPAEPAEPPVDWHLLASYIWAAGTIALTAYGILSYVNLKRKLRESVPIGPGLREADGIRSPFLLGFLRPTIYLPSGLRPEERGHILLHERCHLRHGDHLVKAAFWLAVCLHWFNPLAWLAFTLCGRDMELRCDETVLRDLGEEVRSDYAQSLLSFATGRSMAPAPLAFGEGDTGKRVKHVLTWKKRSLWLTIPAAVLCVTVLVLSALNPGHHLVETQQIFGNRYRSVPVMGEPSKPGQLCFLREYDGHLVFVAGEDITDLGELKQKRLGVSFTLSDEELEQKLRRDNDLAWQAGEYWVLYQENGSLYLVEGQNNVLRLEKVYNMRVRVSTEWEFGSLYDMQEYPAGSGDWETEQQNFVTVGDEATLVWTQSGGEKVLEVWEEYHRMNPDGTEEVIDTSYSLGITRDYGFELPIARRGESEGDWAMYRVELGLSWYVFCVRFGAGPQEPTRAVTFTHDNVFITLQIPESWDYSLTTLENDAYSAGITFWPWGRSEGKLRFDYYPDLFAVCGTGLKSGTMTVAGQTVSVGTYDDDSLWTFLSFGEHFAVWGENHESWWAEYGDQAMAILDSAVFGMETP